jgi:predicted CopG family antitoxin
MESNIKAASRMKTITINDGVKQKLEQLADRDHRSESEVLDELVSRALPVKRHSVRDMLKGKIEDPLTAEDFDALHGADPRSGWRL